MQQIHIVGEFANMMVRNYNEALQFVNEYFQMDYRMFISKYFKGNRKGEINRNITPQKYNKLFCELSQAQRDIIDDNSSKYIVVAAGPGSIDDESWNYAKNIMTKYENNKSNQ
jgi:ATP-dependent DNA helicase RecQ